MCGIFGSRKLGSFEKLYIRNSERGNFSGGSLYVAPGGDMYLKKWEGIKDPGYMSGEYVWAHEYTLYMGHTQAPTSIERDYSPVTTHPFEHGHFCVAHNGVLENHEILREKYLKNAKGICKNNRFDVSKNKVDSAVIPALLDELYVGSDIHAINEVFGLLKGTFACWIYSKHTKSSYLVRSGSTLFGDPLNSNFSSIKYSGLADEIIPEGTIYCITVEGLAEVGKFNNNSSFFIL